MASCFGFIVKGVCPLLLPLVSLQPQYKYWDSKLLAPVVCFAELVNWFMGTLGRATCTVHLSFDQTSLEGIECTKAKYLVTKNLLS